MGTADWLTRALGVSDNNVDDGAEEGFVRVMRWIKLSLGLRGQGSIPMGCQTGVYPGVYPGVGRGWDDRSLLGECGTPTTL